MFSSKKWNPDGKHVYVTGGTAGLGLGLAELLAKKGAHVSIVARNQQRLDAALAKLESARVSPSQRFHAYSHALDTAEASTAALEDVCAPFDGEAPDAIFACAGTSTPKFFVEMTETDLTKGLTNGYWVQAWTAWAASKKLVQQRKKGAKIVFVGSLLSYFSFLGYASYTPAKHALRGLAETLHSELLLYGIDVHIYYPNTIYSPGYEEENKTKPDITKAIEEGDEGVTPEQGAAILLKGVASGKFDIVNDLNGHIFRTSTRGGTRHWNWVVDALLDMVAFIAVPVWRSGVDKKIVAHREEHDKYLQKRGFF